MRCRGKHVNTEMGKTEEDLHSRPCGSGAARDSRGGFRKEAAAVRGGVSVEGWGQGARDAPPHTPRLSAWKHRERGRGKLKVPIDSWG